MNRWLRTALLIGVAVAAASGWLSRERPGHDAGGLPPEAVQTLRLIEAGGPFRYDRDGSVFQNREGLLPQRPRGYYREYTVPTPGSPDRGARRIVSGGDPPQVLYYTDDHYRTFRRIEDRTP
jgi:guanyl-specific ribonuclease Sa